MQVPRPVAASVKPCGSFHASGWPAYSIDDVMCKDSSLKLSRDMSREATQPSCKSRGSKVATDRKAAFETTET